MEFVNEYISYSYTTSDELQKSYCLINQNEKYLFINYNLNSKDCFIEGLQNNYIIEIRISNHYFEKYNETFDIIFEKQVICCQTQLKLFELINCKLSDLHRKLFLESTILYLLFQTQKNNLVFQTGCSQCTVINTPIEEEKIKKAQEFILDHLEENITIQSIAYNIGTNQCYLKKSFKDHTGITIFEFLQENRMNKAKHFLQTTGLSMLEIANRVGYASVSSFCQSYKNYFGISPGKDSKNKISDF